MALSIQTFRNGLFETTHPVSAQLVRGGEVRWSVGSDLASFWRSASKPFQLAVSLDHMDPDAVALLGDEELALGAASHSGEAGHVALVESLLARLGCKEDALQCGAHAPMHEPSARTVATPRQLHSNCSGKHTFMLAACAAQGFDVDYRPRTHPLQRANAAALDSLAQTVHGDGVDGCSIPTFHAPLSAKARAWARLAVAMAEHDGHLGRIGWAMHRAPWFVSGTGRLDEAVMRSASETITAKVGAEGLFCIALPKRREGLAIKVHTGNADALAVAVQAVLLEHGVRLDAPWPWASVSNVRGALVGERRAVWT
jgi:L-asparaginase II